MDILCVTLIKSTNTAALISTTTANILISDNTTGHSKLDDDSEGTPHAWVGWIITAVCSLGIIGNLLNLAVLTKRTREGVDSLERGALYCMIALALSDFMFCLLSFMEKFVSKKSLIFQSKNASYFYIVYGNGLQDALIKTSTWLTVIMGVSRYIAVCHPLRARQWASPSRTLMSIIIGSMLCIALHLPFLWTWQVESISCTDPVEQTIYVLLDGPFSSNLYLRNAFTYMWALLGFFVPVAILAFCNAHLISSLRESARIQRCSQVARSSAAKDAQRRISITLISIVILFFVLICPSEFLHVYGEIIGASDLATYDLAVRITNILQACNFSVNFVLYCIVNTYFRRAMSRMFRAVCPCIPNKHYDDRRASGHNTRFTVLSTTNGRENTCTAL